MLGFGFHEIMEGHVQRDGENFDRPMRFEFDVQAPSVLAMLRTAVGEAIGHVRIDGLAKHAEARGTLSLSPLAEQRIRYAFDFTGDDGRPYRFEGIKVTTARRHLRGWTTLPGKVIAQDGSVWGRAVLRFSMRRDFGGLVRSVRLRTA
jgi:hypothetical protein